MNKLPAEFYGRNDVVKIAKELLGKQLITCFEGKYTSGRIVETEAYNGVSDKASHAFGGRRTPRTEIMFGNGGTAYVYLCYGLHQMFNIVTNTQGNPDAILIRAVEPIQGVDEMLLRAGKKQADHSLTRGPGNVGKALGFHRRQSGEMLTSNKIWLAEDGYLLAAEEIMITKRIGVDYAAEDAALPYRFFIKGNPYVSGTSRQNRVD